MGFVEDLPVVVPTLDEEFAPSFGLLSGWDCRSSAPIDLKGVLGNLGEMTTVEQKFPIQTLDYQLKHIKDTTTKRMTLSVGLGLEMKTFFGLVINVGKAQYTTQHQTELVKEHLQIYYYREDNVKRILPTEEGRQRYKEICDASHTRSATATHIVTEVTLGAHFVADITIETSKSTKLSNKTASGLGSLVIGPISSAVESGLSALCKSPPDKVDIQINAESSHFDGSRKFDTVDQVFAFIKTEIAEGKPVKYFCVPIFQFLPEARLTREVPTYRIIGNHLLQPLFRMIETLNDYKSGEYIRKRIMHADPRFKLILEDVKSLGYSDLIAKEDRTKEISRTLFSDAEDIYNGIPIGATDAIRVKKLLKKYKNQFQLTLKTEVEETIRFYIESYKYQLSIINADDVWDDAPIEFYASKDEFPKPGGEGLTLLIQTHGAEGASRGLFLKLYNLAKVMRICLLLPNASDEFLLTVSWGKPYQLDYHLDDIPKVVEILSASFGVNASGPAFLWYSRLASQMDKPVALPLAKGNTADLQSLLDHVWDNWKYVALLENFIAVKDFLQGSVKGQYVFCFPTSAPFGTPQGKEVVKMLNMYNNKYGTKNNVTWIAADFDFLLDDAPFLIVFQDGKAIGQCYDYLDLLELEGAFLGEAPQVDLSLWVEFSNFRGRRAAYVDEVDIIFNLGVNQNVKERKELHTNEKILTQIENAGSLCSAFMHSEDRNVYVLNAILGMLIGQYPEILAPLEDAGWSRAESRFINDPPLPKEIRDGLIDTFETLVLHLSPSLIQISALMNTVQSCVEDLESNPKLYTEGKKLINDMITSGSLNYVDAIDSEIGGRLREKLKGQKGYQAALERWTESVRIIREELIFKEKVSGEHELIPMMQDALTLLGQVVFEDESDDEDGDEEGKILPEDDATLEIVTRHVLRLPWTSETRKIIEQYMADRLIPKVFEQLSHLQYLEWWNEAHDLFQGMQSSKDYDTLGVILTQLEFKAWSDDQYGSIWKNEVFASWVYDGLDYPTFLEVARQVLIREDGSIPKYIPVPIEKKLRSLVEQPGEEEGENETAIPTDPLHPKEWSTLSDGLTVLQIAVALPIEFPSGELMQLLRRNLSKREEICDGFRKADALFYWDEREKYFTEGWDLTLTRKAVLQIMKLVQDDEDLAVRPIPVESIDPPNLELIALVEFMTFQSAVVATCQLQKRRNVSNRQWNAVWKGNKEYQKIMSTFLSLTTNKEDDEITTSSIYEHLDQLLSSLVDEECHHLIQRVKNLWYEMGLDESKDEIRKQIKEIQSLIAKRALQGKHFFREIFKILEITSELGGYPLQATLNQLVSEFGNGGYSLEFADRYRRHVNHGLLDLISRSDLADLKVFVVGIAGDGGKHALKNALFPSTRHGNSYPSSDHVTLTLWKVPPHEMDSSWYDAFLFVEIDDMFLTEMTPQNERIMTSVLLDVADLTIFHSYKIRDEILVEIESALCHSWSTSGQDRSKTDIIITCGGDLDVDLVKRFTAFEKAVQDNRFILGRRKDGSIAKILTRFEENRGLFPVAETTSGKFGTKHDQNGGQFTVAENISDKFGTKHDQNGSLLPVAETIFDPVFEARHVQTLYEEIIQTSKEFAASRCNKMQTLSSALIKLQTCWTSLLNLPTPLVSHNDVSSYLIHASETLIGFDRVRNLLEIASIQHALDCRKYLAERHPTLRNKYSDTLEIIRTHIFAAGNASVCKPIGHQEGSPCHFCLSAAREWTTFSAKHDFERDNYTKYVTMLNKVQFSRLHRLVKSVEIKQLRGITPDFEKVYEKLLPQYDLDKLRFAEIVVQEFKGVMSDGDLVVSPIRLVEFDITQAYPQSPQLLEDFIKYASTPNKFPDLCELKRGIEIKAKLQNVVEMVRAETSYGEEESRYFYDIGFARKCRDKVETIFFEYETRFLERISDEVRWSGHLYCLKSVLSKSETRSEESLVESVTRVKPILLKEIIRRLGSIIGPVKLHNGGLVRKNVDNY